MIKLAPEKRCTGCAACKNICPQKAITMNENREGFRFPLIDPRKCVNCRLCEKSCPVLMPLQAQSGTAKAHYGYSEDENVRRNSSSGGMFFELASFFLRNGGIVFGAVFDKGCGRVYHTYTENIDGLIPMMGSKYLQSEIGDSFSLAKEFLNAGKSVWFSGTPCQIAGLKRYLGKEYDNLITQDFICHGVPSPKVWRNYLGDSAAKHASPVKAVNFRDKESGWKKYSVSITYEDGNRDSSLVTANPFMISFVRDVILRKSCCNCPSKGIDRVSDLTLADFWGCENLSPEFSDDRGVSLIITHSEKGENLLQNCTGIRLGDVSIDTAIKSNPSISESVPLNSNRKYFFAKVENCGDYAALLRSASERTTISSRLSKRMKAILKRLKN